MLAFENIQQNTPRLVVEYIKVDGAPEQFRWGVVGQIPIIQLVGYVIRIQSDLQFRAPPACPQPALVIVWDAEDRSLSYFVGPNIPVDSLVGMLETVKLALVSSQMEPPKKSEILLPGRMNMNRNERMSGRRP